MLITLEINKMLIPLEMNKMDSSTKIESLKKTVT